VGKVIIGMPLLKAGGGTEVQIYSLVKILGSGGWRISVICYYEWDESVVQQFQEAGIEVRLMNLSRSRDHYVLHDVLVLVVALRRLLTELKPDVFHVQYLAPALVPIIASRLAGVRTVFATSHIAGSYAYRHKAKFLLRIAAKLCTTFFCVSQGVERFWFGDSLVFDPVRPALSRKHFTIYNAVDVDKIREIVMWECREGRGYEGKKLGGEGCGHIRRYENRKVGRKEVVKGGSRKIEGRGINDVGCKMQDESKIKKHGLAGKKVIGIVGRLAEQKGHKVLLEAMKDIVEAVPEVVLLVIGDGPECATIQSLITNHELQDHVQLLGGMQHEEVFKLYGTMDVFAMPSLYEGFGLTATEAMAAGLPVVGTTIEGLSEVIEDGVTGYLVPPGDSKALAQNLIALLNDPAKCQRMGQAGYERVKEHFSMEQFRESMIAVYDQFAAKGEKGRR